jgi:hypothetical protein
MSQKKSLESNTGIGHSHSAVEAMKISQFLVVLKDFYVTEVFVMFLSSNIEFFIKNMLARRSRYFWLLIRSGALEYCKFQFVFQAVFDIK